MTVALELVSDLLFGGTAVTPFAAVMGCISVFNLIVKLNDMMTMDNFLTITLGWAGAVLGSSLQCNEPDAVSSANIDRWLLQAWPALKRLESSLPTKFIRR